MHTFMRGLLQVRLVLARVGMVGVVVSLLWVMAIAIWLLGLPYLQNKLRLQQTEIVAARNAQATPIYPVAAALRLDDRDRLRAFYQTLGESAYVEQQVKTVFAMAAQSGLVLAQADYRFAQDRAGQFSTYQVIFPVKGSYSAVRGFCMKLLLALPFASLDELHFKRATVASDVIELRLKLTLYLKGGVAGLDRDVQPLPRGDGDS